MKAGLSVSPAAKKSPISLTRKFSKFAISLRSIAWPVFALASASFAGRPTNRVSSSNAPSKRNPAISSGSIFLRSRPRYRGMTFPSRQPQPISILPRPQLPRFRHLSRRPLPRRRHYRQTQSPRLRSSLTLNPRSSFALFSALLRVRLDLCVKSLVSLVFFLRFSQNKNPALNRRGPPINPELSLPLPLQFSNSPPVLTRMHASSITISPAARAFSAASSFLNSLLHPYDPRPHANRALHHRRHLLRPAETHSRCLFSPAHIPAAHNSSPPALSSRSGSPEMMRYPRSPAMYSVTS